MIRRFLLALATASAAATPASALTFALNDTGGTGQGTAARRGFDVAAAYWSSVLGDGVTVTLDIGFRSLSGNTLGSAESLLYGTSLTNFVTALRTDSRTAIDAEAVANLPGGTSLSFRSNPLSGGAYADPAAGDPGRLDADTTGNNANLLASRANLKALGFGSALPGDQPDSTIVFNSTFVFDFDPSDGVSAGAIDFVAVAVHEIGHALGFFSGVDFFDARSTPNGPSVASGSLEGSATGTTLDLFRYNAAGERDWSTSDAAKVFSIDGGQSALFGNAGFSLGDFNGDGQQASHWKDAGPGVPYQGIMDPTLAPGTQGIVTALDLAAFDAIGWDALVNTRTNQGYRITTGDMYRQFAAPSAPVPEPATWATLLLGFGTAGAAFRRRRPATRRIAA